MTDLAIRAMLLELPINPRDLYESRDQSFLLWVSGLVEKVSDINRERNARMKAGH